MHIDWSRWMAECAVVIGNSIMKEQRMEMLLMMQFFKIFKKDFSLVLKDGKKDFVSFFSVLKMDNDICAHMRSQLKLQIRKREKRTA